MSVANRIPISVRISQEDADFIANLQVEGANTPSEKIRALLKQARQSYTQPQDYGTALAQAEQFLQNAKRDVLHAEKELGVHSHILARLFELLPDLTATLVADVPTESELEALKKYEREVMWRIVRLTDSILQLEVEYERNISSSCRTFGQWRISCHFRCRRKFSTGSGDE